MSVIVARSFDTASVEIPSSSKALKVCQVLYRWSRCGLETQLAGQLRTAVWRNVSCVIASSLPPEPTVPDIPKTVTVRAWGSSKERFVDWLSDLLRGNCCNLVHARGLWMLPDVLRAAHQAGNLPVVFSFHGFDGANRTVSWWRRRRWRTSVSRCHAVVTISQATRDELAEFLDLAPETIQVIHNGVDTDYFSPNLADAKGSETDGQRTLLCVGSLMRVKGFDVLLAALSRRADLRNRVRVIFAGTDHLDGMLQQQARTAGIDAVFLGSVQDVRSLYRSADALAAPSRSEGLSNTLLEACASGLPVIATAVGGTPELLKAGHSGWLVPPDDADALANAISDLLDHPTKTAQFATAARIRVLRDFQIRQAAEQYLNVYQRVIRAPGRCSQ